MPSKIADIESLYDIKDNSIIAISGFNMATTPEYLIIELYKRYAEQGHPLDEQDIINVAITIANKAPKEFIMFKWKELSAKSVVNFMRMFFEHCRYGQYDYSKNQSTNTSSIRHDLGKRVLFS